MSGEQQQNLERLPLHPRQHPHVYALGPDGPILISFRADGLPGGTGELADIVGGNPRALSSR